jgi:hypothetical protein
MAEGVHALQTNEWRRIHAGSIGSIAESIVGIVAAAIAIIALAGVLPQMLLAVAIIAASAALVLEGGAIASRFSALVYELSETRLGTSELGSGVTTEFVGGVAGIVLGILMLLNVYPMTLASVAVILFGGTLLISSGITARMNSIIIENIQMSQFAKDIAHQAIVAAAGVQILIGIGTVTLGILSLTGLNPLVLSLVAVLAVGVSDLLNTSAIAGRLLNMFSEHHEPVRSTS